MTAPCLKRQRTLPVRELASLMATADEKVELLLARMISIVSTFHDRLMTIR